MSPSRGGVETDLQAQLASMIVTVRLTAQSIYWYNLHVTFGVWRSWLARTAGGREVAGSSPVTPTTIKARHFVGLFYV